MNLLITQKQLNSLLFLSENEKQFNSVIAKSYKKYPEKKEDIDYAKEFISKNFDSGLWGGLTKMYLHNVLNDIPYINSELFDVEDSITNKTQLKKIANYFKTNKNIIKNLPKNFSKYKDFRTFFRDSFFTKRKLQIKRFANNFSSEQKKIILKGIENSANLRNLENVIKELSDSELKMVLRVSKRFKGWDTLYDFLYDMSRGVAQTYEGVLKDISKLKDVQIIYKDGEEIIIALAKTGKGINQLTCNTNYCLKNDYEQQYRYTEGYMPYIMTYMPYNVDNKFAGFIVNEYSNNLIGDSFDELNNELTSDKLIYKKTEKILSSLGDIKRTFGFNYIDIEDAEFERRDEEQNEENNPYGY